MNTSILSKIRTKLDLEYLSGDIEELRENLFKVHDTELDVPYIIRDEFIKAPDKNAFLEALKSDMLNVRILELTTAVYLDEKSISRISNWVKVNIGPDVVIDLNIDPEIMAGVNMTFQGKFKEFSLRDIFENSLSQLF